ncbi:MAG TPA: cupin domain-containing protein [Terriglobales bacterium]|nr:cupin domain-containing protein [Terriglobales bacterium]
MSKKLVRFGVNPPAAEEGRPGNVLSGNPVTQLQNYYSDPTGQFFAGVWESAPGKWTVDYSEEEFCTFLAGKAILTAEDGTSETFITGDAFIIPRGFKGTWETVEPVKKWYVIFEPKSA